MSKPKLPEPPPIYADDVRRAFEAFLLSPDSTRRDELLRRLDGYQVAWVRAVPIYARPRPCTPTQS
jgi:hypothetical protein